MIMRFLALSAVPPGEPHPGEFAALSKIVAADKLMPSLTGRIWRPVLVVAEAEGALLPGHDFDQLERWFTYITLMLVGARAQGVSDAETDRRLLARMLLPALVRAEPAAPAAGGNDAESG